MTDFSQLLQRNAEFAKHYKGEMPQLPRYQLIILTCVDARVDPAHFLGLELGEAVVIRSAGARVTHDVELQIGVLSSLITGGIEEKEASITLAIIHHTDCGIERLANPAMRQMLSQKMSVPESEFESRAIHDHTESIKQDIERLTASTLVPDGLTINAYIYNVETGLVEQVS